MIGDDLYVFGGFTLNREDHDKNNLNDLWIYSFKSKSWQEVIVREKPPGRGYHTADALGPHLYTFGGARCAGSCTCKNDVWRFNTKKQDWELMDPGKAQPNTRYRQSMA